MKKVLVLCNHVDKDQAFSTPDYNETIYVNPNPPNQNVNLHVDSLTHRIFGGFDPLAFDLLQIASYVYCADRSISRGETDVFAERWSRSFDFVIPVSNPDLWNQPQVINSLKESLEFLTGDQFSFSFKPPKPKGQLFLRFPDNPFPGADCISLFSGGIDSLVGSLFLLKEKRLNPLLVSHRSMPTTRSRQRELVQLLRERNPGAEFPHLSIWVNRMNQPSVEETQRARAFLYLSGAVAVATQLDIGDIFICENGVVSINIPVSGQNVGTYLTRSTHPKFIKCFDQFIRILFNNKITIANPFIFHTKAEMLELLKAWNQHDLIQATISCSYTNRRTSLQPQCGTCSQCVGRRFSVITADIEDSDNAAYYEKDIFINPLEEGRETAFSEGYVRTAFEIKDMDDVHFFSKYPEVAEVVDSLEISAEECGKRIYDLFLRNSNEIVGATVKMYQRYLVDHLSGKLPDNSLISMLGSKHHLLNPAKEYAEKLGRIIADGIRLDFRSEKPKNENRLQECVQALLSAANERLRRESPMLSYSLVLTKPDFSDIRDLRNILFVELKFMDNRPKLNKINTEITSRITVYRDQGAFVLFVVYDTDNFIHDDKAFISDYEKHEGIKVIVVR